MKTLTRQGIQRMTTGGTTVVGGSGSGSGGSGGGGSADYAAEAGHAQTADEATHATSADSATTATNLDANSTDWEKIARKDIAQSIAEVFTFAKGIVSTLKSYFNGGIEVTNGTKTDVLNVTGGANVGGSLAVTGNSTIGGNETVTGSVTAAMLIADALKNPAFVAAVNMIGKGFGVTIDQNGKATLQTDDLLVLGQMIVNSLNIREVSYIGGTFILTPAGSTVAKVMPLYADSTSHIQYAQYWSTTESYYQVGYRLMWKADDGTTGTMNYWNVGDMAYCHTYNITAAGDYTTEANRHYWRLVVGKGTVTISGETFHYADVADIDTVYIPNVPTAIQGRENNSGSVPAEGDKVVCLGSMTDSTRRGAVQITAEGEASIGIYDGINAYTSLSNYEIHYLSKTIVRMRSDKFTWRSSGGTLRTQANFENSIAQAGIDIDNGEINLIAGKVNFLTSGGQANPKISIDPSTGTLNAADGNFSGTVKATTLYMSYAEIFLVYDVDTSPIDIVARLGYLPNNIYVKTSSRYSDENYFAVRLPEATDYAGHVVDFYGQNLYNASAQYYTEIHLGGPQNQPGLFLPGTNPETPSEGQIVEANLTKNTGSEAWHVRVISDGTCWRLLDYTNVYLIQS